MMSLIILTLRYMAGRKLRTALTTLSIVFGVMMVYGNSTAIPSVREALRRANAVPGSADLRLTMRSGGAFVADEALFGRLQAVEGVEGAAGVLRRRLSVPLGENALEIEVIGIDVAGRLNLYRAWEGRGLLADERGAALLPSSLAGLAGLRVGERLPLPTTSGLRFFEIVGIFDDRGRTGVAQIVLTLAEAQAVFGLEGQINAIEVLFEAGAPGEAVTAGLLETLGPDYRAGEEFKVETPLLDEDLVTAINGFFSLMALAVGAFLIFNSLRTAVAERRYDLALLRAMGAESGQTLRLVLLESLLVGTAGTLIGLPLGYAFGLLALNTVIQIYPMIFGHLTLTLGLDGGALLLAVGLGIGTSLLAGYLPARAAGRVSPLALLRPATGQQSAQTTRRELLIGLGLLAV
ncbi:MAG: FtsX-like permease family protein, partial [Chloroflexi bacterium]|nr:FtsX-like permease family protein [Chloroflexota bacterium]